MNTTHLVAFITIAVFALAIIAFWFGWSFGFDAGKIDGWKRGRIFGQNQPR